MHQQLLTTPTIVDFSHLHTLHRFVLENGRIPSIPAAYTRHVIVRLESEMTSFMQLCFQHSLPVSVHLTSLTMTNIPPELRGCSGSLAPPSL